MAWKYTPKASTTALMDDFRTRREIKIINDRLKRLANDFGLNSATYKTIVDNIDNKHFTNFLRQDKNGVVQIINNKSTRTQIINRENDANYLLDIARKKVKTTKELLKNSEGKNKEEKIKFKEYDEKLKSNFEAIKQQFYDNYTVNEQKDLLPELFDNSKKSYDELIDLTSKMGFILVNDNENIFEGKIPFS